MEIVNSKDFCTCVTKPWKITLVFKDNYNNLYFDVVYFGRGGNFVSFKKTIFTSIIHTELCFKGLKASQQQLCNYVFCDYHAMVFTHHYQNIHYCIQSL
jgi:hypothetical protein